MLEQEARLQEEQWEMQQEEELLAAATAATTDVGQEMSESAWFSRSTLGSSSRHTSKTVNMVEERSHHYLRCGG